MANKSTKEIELEPNPELLAAARVAYQMGSNSFWEELTERLYPAPGVAVEGLPRRSESSTS